ncbi:MAG: helix-turn-helix transcriptional regulator [Dokdonella sp.]|uniref:helix-turn-helix transcriptional regulator n=1 Tax=Dokdonella sp. TaxID=2291710 RepID=UPI003267EDC6
MGPPKRRASDRTFFGPLSSRIRHARRVAGFTQAALAKNVGVGPSAVAQWELPKGTSPTIEHMIEIGRLAGVSFEWLSTGRGPVSLVTHETPAIDGTSFTTDAIEDRLLAAFRRVPARKRETLVRWMEEFF